MFGMGFSEILVIALVAILFLGPDKLPEAMVQIAKFFNSVRRTVNEAKSTFEEELHLKELKEEALSYRQSLSDATSDISGFKNAVPNPADELEEALQVARSGMPADRLNASVDELWEEEEEEATDLSRRPAVTEYKEMARKALEEAKEPAAEPSARKDASPSDEKSETHSDSRPATFKNLADESEA